MGRQSNITNLAIVCKTRVFILCSVQTISSTIKSHQLWFYGKIRTSGKLLFFNHYCHNTIDKTYPHIMRRSPIESFKMKTLNTWSRHDAPEKPSKCHIVPTSFNRLYTGMFQAFLNSSSSYPIFSACLISFTAVMWVFTTANSIVKWTAQISTMRFLNCAIKFMSIINNY